MAIGLVQTALRAGSGYCVLASALYEEEAIIRLSSEA
jgi:hypothetical protein